MGNKSRWTVRQIVGLTFMDEGPISDDLISQRAERYLIAAALNDSLVSAQLGSWADRRDYLSPVACALHDAIVSLVADGAKVDGGTLCSRLREIGRLTTVGGASGIIELSNELSGTAHAQDFAAIVRESARIRRMASAAREVIHRADNAAPLADVEAAASEVAKAATADESPKGTVTLAESVDAVFDALTSGKAAPGLTTGLTDLNRLLGGLRPGQMIVIGARPAMGKSALAQGIAFDIARAESDAAEIERRMPKRTIFASLEMSHIELTQRRMASAGRVDLARMIRGEIEPHELAAAMRAGHEMKRLPVTYLDGAKKLSDIRAEAYREHARVGLSAIVVDYIQLIDPERRSDSDNREREVAESARGLKLLAKALGIPVIVLAQLNRGLEARKDKRPTLADLRESGAIEQDADVVAFIYRDEIYNRDTKDAGVAEIIVQKQRNGPTGTVRVRFDGSHCVFRDLTPAADVFRGYAPEATMEPDTGETLPHVAMPGELVAPRGGEAATDAPEFDF